MLIILFLAESLPSFRKIGETWLNSTFIHLFSPIALTSYHYPIVHDLLWLIELWTFTPIMFSGILQLISSIFVTCLTFVFPPLFYMRLIDMDKTKDSQAKWVIIIVKLFLFVRTFPLLFRPFLILIIISGESLFGPGFYAFKQ